MTHSCWFSRKGVIHIWVQALWPTCTYIKTYSMCTLSLPLSLSLSLSPSFPLSISLLTEKRTVDYSSKSTLTVWQHQCPSVSFLPTVSTSLLSTSFFKPLSNSLPFVRLEATAETYPRLFQQQTHTCICGGVTQGFVLCLVGLWLRVLVGLQEPPGWMMKSEWTTRHRSVNLYGVCVLLDGDTLRCKIATRRSK